jgi:hypothetical protein
VTATFLPMYLEQLDAGEDVLPLFAPGFSFSFLWSEEKGASEFTGGYEEFAGYMAQRDAGGQLHHVSHSLREGNVEVASGWTTRHGEPLATFTFAVELDEQGRALRLFAARTTAWRGRPF